MLLKKYAQLWIGVMIIYTKQIQLARKNTSGSMKKHTRINSNVYETVLARDNKQCVICGSNRNLHAHHYIYRSHLGLGIEENLVMICKRCHINVHERDDGTLKNKLKKHLDKHYPEFSDEQRKYNKFRKEEE